MEVNAFVEKVADEITKDVKNAKIKLKIDAESIIGKSEIDALIKKIREEVPGIHLRTTLMVGHPGESEEDFNELMEFVKEVKFERMGKDRKKVSVYSVEQ